MLSCEIPRDNLLVPKIRHYRELRVFQQGKKAAMRVFNLSKTFPREERYSMIDQMRRSSRSVCTNIAEAWRKRRYPASFVAKLSDAETEAEETRVWLEFALECNYMNETETQELDHEYDEIVAGLVQMIRNPKQWLVREDRHSPPPPLTLSPPLEIQDHS